MSKISGLKSIPIIVLIIGVLANSLISIPLWLGWNHIAPTYFNCLPQMYQEIPFLDVLSFVIIIIVSKRLFFKL